MKKHYMTPAMDAEEIELEDILTTSVGGETIPTDEIEIEEESRKKAPLEKLLK